MDEGPDLVVSRVHEVEPDPIVVGEGDLRGERGATQHVALGQDHRVSIPASALLGSLLLLCADALSRSLGSGSALPVGAITSLLGAPFFLTIIFSRKEHGQC